LSKVNSAALSTDQIKDISAKVGPRFGLKNRPWLSDGLALLFFTVVSLVFLIPLTGNLAESAINEGDDLQQMWSMGWVIHALTTDPANLFNANIFYPYPNTLAYSDHLIIQALFSLPVVLLSNNLVLGYNLGMVFSFVMSGWGTYLLVKDLTGNRAAGLLAGMIFAYAPYKVGHLSQLNLLSTQWIPFCFLFFRRILLNSKAGWRSGWGVTLAFTLFFVFNALSSTYYLFFILPLLGLYFILFYLSRWRWPRPISLLQLLVGFGLAFVVLLPTFIPYLQVSAEQAAERTVREVEQFSANYRFYFGVGDNNLFWAKTLSRYAGLGGERQLFPGGLALLFTIVALAAPLLLKFRKSSESRVQSPESKAQNPSSDTQHPAPDTQHPAPDAPNSALSTQHPLEPYLFFALGLFALFMSFGLVLHVKGLDIPTPYRLFYDYFPGWRGLRAAMRYGLFVLFALAVTAGFGVAFLTPFVRRLAIRAQWARFSLPVLLTGLLLLGAFWEYRSDISRINPGILPNPPQVYRWLAEPSRAGVVLELPMAAPGALPSIRDYYSTFNWQPTVNGESGYMPPVYNDLYALSQDITSKEALATFQGMGVRWLVYHLNDENIPFAPGEWEKLEAKLSKTKEIKLVQDFPQDKIRVYELAPDPWMQQIIDQIPAKSDVIVSDYRRNQPTALELVETLLRRRNYQLYGNDRAGYRFLNAPPTGRPVSYGLFSADEDPRPYGFSQDEASWSGHGLKLYSRKTQPAVAYDLSRDPKLAEFNALKGTLELEIAKNELKFNGKSLGNGNELSGKALLKLQLSSLNRQTLKISQNGQDKTFEVPAGLSNLVLGPFSPGDKLRLEPPSGATLYLNRAELGPGDQALAALTPVPQAALMVTNSRTQNGHLFSTFEIYLPKLGEGELNNYLLSLDVYRKPWGTHPSGHFGVWSVALNGADQPRRLEFDFDPVAKTTRVTLDGANLDVGAEVIRPGDGDWAAFMALRRVNPQNVKDFELLGVARLYEFNLNGPQLRDLNLLPGRQLVYLPTLK
jgi:hypothetical protein